MWQFLKDTKYLIVSLLAIILDGIITYYIPSYFNKMNIFYPMLTLSLIPFLYYNNLKKYYYSVFALGMIYDLLYTDIFLYNAIIFLVISIIDFKILNYFRSSLLLLIALVILNIILYDTISFILVIITNYQIVTINDLIYKISNSIILNIMSVFVYFFLFKKRSHYT